MTEVSKTTACGPSCRHFLQLFEDDCGGCELLDGQHPGSEFAMVLLDDDCVVEQEVSK